MLFCCSQGSGFRSNRNLYPNWKSKFPCGKPAQHQLKEAEIRSQKSNPFHGNIVALIHDMKISNFVHLRHTALTEIHNLVITANCLSFKHCI